MPEAQPSPAPSTTAASTSTTASPTNVTFSNTAQPEVKQPDLITRATQIKQEKAPASNSNDFFDPKELESLSPEAKVVAEKAYKTMQAGLTRKFQEISDLRKSLEQQKQSTWTPERLQEELRKPDFVQAAQMVSSKQNPTNSGYTDSEYSALSDQEKARLHQLESEISSLKQMNYQATRSQEDEKLKTRYANYDPQVIGQLEQDLIAGKTIATREHLYKAFYHDDNMKKMYELGRQDEREEKNNKIDAMPYSTQSNNLNTQPSNQQPAQGESDRSFFNRLLMANKSRVASSRK